MQAFLPLLGTDPSLTGPPGRVVNITSIMSRKTIPLISGYCASKHALEALTDAMRREFGVYGIKVVNVAPGTTPPWAHISSITPSRHLTTKAPFLMTKFLFW